MNTWSVTTPGVVTTPGDIIQAAVALGIDVNSVLFADDQYLIPSDGWIENVFTVVWPAAKHSLGILEYEINTNDCDDFARLCAGYAQILNNAALHGHVGPHEGPDHIPHATLAFGEFWYQAPHGWHAINAYLCQDKKAGLKFFEPQTNQSVKLTPSEIQSCTWLRF